MNGKRKAHTPGPWMWAGDHTFNEYYLTTTEKFWHERTKILKTQISFSGVKEWLLPGFHNYDALLIAAAPDLLDALKTALHAVEHYVKVDSLSPSASETLGQVKGKIQAAIDKATKEGTGK